MQKTGTAGFFMLFDQSKPTTNVAPDLVAQRRDVVPEPATTHRFLRHPMPLYENAKSVHPDRNLALYNAAQFQGGFAEQMLLPLITPVAL